MTTKTFQIFEDDGIIFIVSDEKFGEKGDILLSLVDDESYGQPFQLERRFTQEELTYYGFDPDENKKIVGTSRILFDEFLPNISKELYDFLMENRDIDEIELKCDEDGLYLNSEGEIILPKLPEKPAEVFKMIVRIEGPGSMWNAITIKDYMEQSHPGKVILIEEGKRAIPEITEGVLIIVK